MTIGEFRIEFRDIGLDPRFPPRKTRRSAYSWARIERTFLTQAAAVAWINDPKFPYRRIVGVEPVREVRVVKTVYINLER